MGEITEMLSAAASGQAEARERLYTRIYSELRSLAGKRLGGDSTVLMQDAASLVHEAELRLAHQQLPASSRHAFCTYPSNVMHSVIVDHVRERGGGVSEVTLVTQDRDEQYHKPDVLALDLALSDLERVDNRCRQIVELKFFVGLSVDEIAQALQISPATVQRDWQKARAYLYRSLRK